MKRCKKCGERKPLDDFHRASGTRDGHRGECKACHAADSHRRYLANPEPVKARVKRWQQENAEELNAYRRQRRLDPVVKSRDRAGHLLRKYGITLEEYDAMLGEQNGVCFLCGSAPSPPYSLHVDHDHTSGRIRHLLCFKCNNALGDFDDDPARVRAAAAYLEAGIPRSEAIERRLAGLRSTRPAWGRV